MMNIINHAISAYDFERVLNINCSPGEESFTSLENAKDECKINENCMGVLQKNCTEDQDYYECFKNETSSSQSQIESCFYKKFSIGMYFHQL